jgi:hypothetical protein
MATLAMTQRRRTQHEPHANFHGTPLSREDCLNSQMVAYPFCLFDCRGGRDRMTTADRAGPEAEADLPCRLPLAAAFR